MDLLDDTPPAVILGLLALLDGLSVGTLLIPLFLLLAPGGVRVSRVLLYLATIAVFYLAVGVLFTLGLVNLVDVAQDLLTSTAGRIVRLATGVALVLVAILMGRGSSVKSKGATAAASVTDRASHEAGTALPPQGTARRVVPVTPPSAPAPAGVPASGPATRLTRWRDRLLAPEASGAAVMAVALGAGLVEIATMLPYLVAMGMLAEAPLDAPVRIAGLAAYCAVMILPAIVLLVLRIVAAPLVERPLARLAAWMERTSRENTAWIIGIVGFLVARGAAAELGLFDALDRLG